MSSFADRSRVTLEEAKALVVDHDHPSILGIRHILDNGDGTFSVMCHISCEWCDYCEEARGVADPCMVHKAKEDPYEKVGRS